MALRFVVIDETPEASAIIYSRFSFHGQFQDTDESWSIQAEGRSDGRTQAVRSGTVHLPKGVPVNLFSSLVDSVRSDRGGIVPSHIKRDDWILEYRFGTSGDWTACEESSTVYPQHTFFSASLGALSGDEAVLEIRIR